MGLSRHLDSVELLNGDPLPSSVPSRVNSRVASRIASIAASRAASRRESPCHSPRADADAPKPAKSKRSPWDTSPLLAIHLCAKLNYLRKVGRAQSPERAASLDHAEEAISSQGLERGSLLRPGSAHMEEDGGPLLLSALGCTTDTVDSLRDQEAVMYAAEEETFGSRHATACIADRTLAVIGQKIKRLQALQEKRKHYDRCLREREALLESAFNGEECAMDQAREAAGLAQSIEKSVHKDGKHDGRPQDADRSDFGGFLKKFGLPDSHREVLLARGALNSGLEVWAATALANATAEFEKYLASDQELEEMRRKDMLAESRARAGVNDVDMHKVYLGVARMRDLALLASGLSIVPGMNELLEDIQAEVNSLIATKLRLMIDDIMAKDQEEAERAAAKPDIGGKRAQKGADALQHSLNDAFVMGLPSAHKQAVQTRVAITDLKAEAVRREALALIAADAESFRTNGFIKGATLKCANIVEKMVGDAVKGGLPGGHAKLQAALQACKEMREQTGQRRRTAAHKDQ